MLVGKCNYSTRYGESLPGDIATSVNDGGDMVSLTVNNALSDLAAFMTAQEAALSPSGVKRTWLMVGGSYPGALSAWFRVKVSKLLAFGE